MSGTLVNETEGWPFKDNVLAVPPRDGVVALAFTVEEYGVSQPSQAARVTVLLELTDAKLSRVRSTVRDLDTGEVTLQRTWLAGDRSIHEVSVHVPHGRDYPLPTRPHFGEVVEDSIGPIDDPIADGFTRSEDGSFRKEENYSVRRLWLGDTLGERVLETLSLRRGTVQSRVLDIGVTLREDMGESDPSFAPPGESGPSDSGWLTPH